MLAEIELKILYSIYFVSSTKYTKLPFGWVDGKLNSHPNNHRKFYNNILILTILCHLAYCFKSFSEHIHKGNINASIVQMIFIIGYSGHFILRVNLLIFKAEIVRLINGSLMINTNWGKQAILKIKYNFSSVLKICVTRFTLEVGNNDINIMLSIQSFKNPEYSGPFYLKLFQYRSYVLHFLLKVIHFH